MKPWACIGVASEMTLRVFLTRHLTTSRIAKAAPLSAERGWNV
jgi:hypothetical protein